MAAAKPKASAGWLVKSEPSVYPWSQLVREKKAIWDGVRNAQARNNLAAMKSGDRVLFYHSNEGKEIVGIAKVARTAYQDPTTDDPRWLVVELAPSNPLARPVTLAEIKADPELRKIPLVTQSRLSVMPIDASAFARILELSRPRASRK
jgi:predicted RNA-binding protein with PUA-like domain